MRVDEYTHGRASRQETALGLNPSEAKALESSTLSSSADFISFILRLEKVTQHLMSCDQDPNVIYIPTTIVDGDLEED